MCFVRKKIFAFLLVFTFIFIASVFSLENSNALRIPMKNGITRTSKGLDAATGTDTPLHDSYQLVPVNEVKGGANGSYALSKGNFITRDDNSYRLWNGNTGELIHDFSKDDGSRIKEYGISELQNGNFITKHLDGSWKLRNGSTGKIINTLSIKGVEIRCAGFFTLSSGNFITGTRGSVSNNRIIWDGNTGSVIAVVPFKAWQSLSSDDTYELPNGNIVTRISNGIKAGIAVIIEGNSGKVIATLSMQMVNVVFRGIGILPKENRFFTKASEGDCFICDGNTGRVINVLSGHGGAIKSAPGRYNSSKQAISSPRGLAEQLIMGNEGLRNFLKPTHNNLVAQHGICELPNGDVVTADSDGRCRIWRNGEAIYALEVPGISVGLQGLKIASGRNILTRDEDGVFSLWNGYTGEFISTLLAEGTNNIQHNDFYCVLSTGKIITNEVDAHEGESNRVRMNDGNTGRLITVLSEEEHLLPPFFWLYELPGGKFVMRDPDGICRVRDGNTGEIVGLLLVPGVHVGHRGVHVLSSGNILTNDSDEISRIWKGNNRENGHADETKRITNTQL